MRAFGDLSPVRPATRRLLAMRFGSVRLNPLATQGLSPKTEGGDLSATPENHRRTSVRIWIPLTAVLTLGCVTVTTPETAEPDTSREQTAYQCGQLARACAVAQQLDRCDVEIEEGAPPIRQVCSTSPCLALVPQYSEHAGCLMVKAPEPTPEPSAAPPQPSEPHDD